MIARFLKGFFGALLLGLLARLYFIRQYVNKMNKLYKGPPPSLLLGNLLDLVKEGGFGEQFFQNLHANYGTFARLWLGPSILNLSVNDPEMQATLYRKTSQRPKETEMFLNYLGHDNLLFQRGENIKELRNRYFKMVTGPEVMLALHGEVVRTMLLKSRNWHLGPVDVHYEFGEIIYDIVGRVLFREPWEKNETGLKIRKAHLYCIKNVNRWMFFPDWLKPKWNAEYKEYVDTVARLRELCGEMLDGRRKEIEANPERFKNDTCALTFLCTDTYFTPHLAVSTLIGFLNGSYDTTHATITWLLYNLAKNGHVQEKLMQELDSRIGRSITASVEELRELPYLNACIMESMRLFCTVPINQRVNLDEEMNLNGEIVPKGTNVNVAMIVTMKSEIYFGKDPLTYAPERFLGEDSATKQRIENWMPFGNCTGSTRACVGQIFAMTELKAIVATLLQKFTLRLHPDTGSEYKTEAGVTQPTGPVLIYFDRRP